MRNNQIQCTYCGAILNLREGISQIECEYCGNTMGISWECRWNDEYGIWGGAPWEYYTNVQ